MENPRKQDQPRIKGMEYSYSPMEYYSRGLTYFTAFLAGVSQAGIYLLGNYSQPGSFRSSGNLYAPHRKSPRVRANDPETSSPDIRNSRLSQEDMLSSAGKISVNWLTKNAPLILQSFLEFFSLAYSSNYELRRHIKGIKARYLFLFGDSERQISLEIKNSGMRVFPGNTDKPDISIKFRDSEALRNLLSADKTDVLKVILKQDIVAEGNLIYLFKFIYLLNHLQFKLMGPA
jgi:hypothetical protein